VIGHASLTAWRPRRTALMWRLKWPPDRPAGLARLSPQARKPLLVTSTAANEQPRPERGCSLLSARRVGPERPSREPLARRVRCGATGTAGQGASAGRKSNLERVAAGRCEPVGLAGSFDSLGEAREIECLAHGDNRAGKGGRALIDIYLTTKERSILTTSNGNRRR